MQNCESAKGCQLKVLDLPNLSSFDRERSGVEVEMDHEGKVEEGGRERRSVNT